MSDKVLDRVHYTQITYRKLLDAMARPGKLVQLERPPFDSGVVENEYVLGIGATLLDQEVTFHAAGDPALARTLQLYTLSAPQTIELCDYLFIDGAGAVGVPEIAACKRGAYEYPDESATVICRVERISRAGEAGESDRSVKLKLRGPGISGETEVVLEGLRAELLPEWRTCNEEFPLGIDWIFVDGQGVVCCVPRSTQWKEEVL